MFFFLVVFKILFFGFGVLQLYSVEVNIVCGFICGAKDFVYSFNLKLQVFSSGKILSMISLNSVSFVYTHLLSSLSRIIARYILDHFMLFSIPIFSFVFFILCLYTVS